MKTINAASKTHLITTIFLAFISFLLAACNAAPTQVKTTTVGVLVRGNNLTDVLTGFKAGMAELGYTDKTLSYVVKELPSNSLEDVKAGAKDLIDSKVDMILALSSPVALGAKAATAGTELPVIFVPGSDPVKSGLVESLKSPNGNLTGIATGYQYPTRVLEYLRTVLPNAKRVFIMYDAKNLGAGFYAPLQESAPKLGLEMVVQNVTNDKDVLAALDNIPANIDAIFMIPDPWVYNRIDDVSKASIKLKLPFFAADNAVVKVGALLGYSWEYSPAGKQAARIADKVLKGEKPASFPVESAEYFLKVNLKTSQAIGITIPDSILQQASEIIR